MKLALLGTLPPELIFRILDFMDPYDMAGLSCACRSMLLLVNRKLDIEGRELDPLGTYISRTGQPRATACGEWNH